MLRTHRDQRGEQQRCGESSADETTASAVAPAPLRVAYACGGIVALLGAVVICVRLELQAARE